MAAYRPDNPAPITTTSDLFKALTGFGKTEAIAPAAIDLRINLLALDGVLEVELLMGMTILLTL